MKTLNNNIQESYCSFEVSRLLRERVFKVPVTAYYDEFGKIMECVKRDKNSIKHLDTKVYGVALYYSAPTHALAIEWLRVNFNWWIEIYRNASGYGYIIQKADNGSVYKEIDDSLFFEKPQQATEEALKYVLNKLI